MTGASAPKNDDERSMKALRRENSSAWLELTDNQTLPFVIDALLESPPGREFNKSELSEHAGPSRESIRRHLPILLKFGIVEEVPDTEPTRYRLNDRGKATAELFELNSALNSVGGGEEPNIPVENGEDDDQLLRLNLPDDNDDVGIPEGLSIQV